MNIYFVTGHIPLIISIAIANKYHDGECNVLVMEIGTNITKHKRYEGKTESYHDIDAIISDCYHWDQIFIIDVVKSGHGNTQKNWYEKIYSKLPTLQAQFSLSNAKEVRMNLNKLKDSVGRVDNVFYCDNSVSYRLLRFDRAATHIIEHGASSYSLNLADDNLVGFVRKVKKKIYSKIMGLSSVSPDIFYLTDNNNSSAYDIEKNKNIIKSINIKKYVATLFDDFFSIYEKRCPDAYSELESMLLRVSGYSNVYIYLPTEIVPLSLYGQYLEQELKAINGSDSFFIIKNHHRDKADYRELFSTYDSSSFVESKNRSLPVEMLLYFFDRAKLLGNYSSAFLYSNWWLERSGVLTSNYVDDDFSYTNYELSNEYSSVLNDLIKLNKTTL